MENPLEEDVHKHPAATVPERYHLLEQLIGKAPLLHQYSGGHNG